MPANTAEVPLVLVGGGMAAAAWLEACGIPFTQSTGIAVTHDAAIVSNDAVADMVDDDQTRWDVCAIDAALCQRLGKAGLLRLLDFKIVARSALLPGDAGSWWGVPGWYVARVLAFDGERMPRPVHDWSDLWAVEALPGARAVSAGDGFGMAEAALLADGVPPDALYPLDLDRACAKWLTLRDTLVVCDDEAALAAAMSTGKAVMAAAECSTVYRLHRQDGRFGNAWRGAVLTARLLGVVQANPAGEAAAMRFIASCQLATHQLAMLRLAGLGPASDAGEALSAGLAAGDPVSEAHRREGVVADSGWYQTHGDAWSARWRSLLTGIAADGHTGR